MEVEAEAAEAAPVEVEAAVEAGAAKSKRTWPPSSSSSASGSPPRRTRPRRACSSVRSRVLRTYMSATACSPPSCGRGRRRSRLRLRCPSSGSSRRRWRCGSLPSRACRSAASAEWCRPGAAAEAEEAAAEVAEVEEEEVAAVETKTEGEVRATARCGTRSGPRPVPTTNLSRRGGSPPCRRSRWSQTPSRRWSWRNAPPSRRAALRPRRWCCQRRPRRGSPERSSTPTVRRSSVSCASRWSRCSRSQVSPARDRGMQRFRRKHS